MRLFRTTAAQLGRRWLPQRPARAATTEAAGNGGSGAGNGAESEGGSGNGSVTSSPTLDAIYDDVDVKSAKLEARHKGRLQCRIGCASCCVDDMSVWAVEADRIRRNYAELLTNGQPHAHGACAFLDADKACRIYHDRPYVCRNHGLPLRWDDFEEEAEMRDICPLNDDGSGWILSLPKEELFELGPTEGRLAELQRELDGASGANEKTAWDSEAGRVKLRDLFAHQAPRSPT
ncbi:hypothetical protein T484DRAFT_1955227 [Baffinella frigidus]|jgi:Fe-S-cluster containining protein|nr:hypothetical protein T484DRAFT_1955227 [Cryptophyta sp. CCMP2293]|mmetsp:Transcript_16790/g.40477  ORF Transcript_16790/g.40477 Transcript_16790/m.40477 type:complete len:233 (-) Transcript_16790:157-855(-)